MKSRRTRSQALIPLSAACGSFAGRCGPWVTSSVSDVATSSSWALLPSLGTLDGKVGNAAVVCSIARAWISTTVCKWAISWFRSSSSRCSVAISSPWTALSIPASSLSDPRFRRGVTVAGWYQRSPRRPQRPQRGAHRHCRPRRVHARSCAPYPLPKHSTYLANAYEAGHA